MPGPHKDQSRNHRRLKRFATSEKMSSLGDVTTKGAEPTVPNPEELARQKAAAAGGGRRLSEFAPVAGVSSKTPSTAPKTSKAAITSVDLFQVMLGGGLCAKNDVSKEQGRIVRTIAGDGAAAIQSSTAAPIIRRVVCSSKRERAVAVVLGTCELAYRLAATKAAPRVLVIEQSDDDAKWVAGLFKQVGVSAVHIGESTGRTSSNPALSSVVSPISPLDVALKAHKVVTKAAEAEFRKIPFESQAGMSLKDVSFAIKAAPAVAVTSLSNLFALSESHFKSGANSGYDAVIINEPSTKDEEMYHTVGLLLRTSMTPKCTFPEKHSLKSVFVLASSPQLALHRCIDGVIGKQESEESEAVAALGDFPLSYFVSEGVPRLQQLLTLLINQGERSKIVVHCATAETAVFLTDMLYALKIPEAAGNFRLLCDSENYQEKDILMQDVASIEGRFDRIQVGKGGSGVVLVSAFGIVPKTGTVFVQYDPVVSMSHFTGSVLARISIPVAAYHKHVEAVTMAAAVEDKTPIAPYTAPAAANGFEYKHAIMFLYPTEENGAIALISSAYNNVSAIKASIVPQRLAPTSVGSCGAAFLAIKKLSTLHKRIFAIQNRAYEGYRSLMQVYSRLRPKSVFDVDELNLPRVAAQFGYDEANLPLLDLRTKATQFRPREDYVKAAAIKKKACLKRDREFASNNIVGAGPDSDWMIDCPPEKEAEE